MKAKGIWAVLAVEMKAFVTELPLKARFILLFDT